MDFNPSTPLDSRPRWAHEQYYEGDIRTWHAVYTQQAPEAEKSSNLFEQIPLSIQNQIAEVLELRISINAYNNTIALVWIDEGEYTINCFSEYRLPIHRPAFRLFVQNTHPSLYTRFNWNILYRKKVFGKE